MNRWLRGVFWTAGVAVIAASVMLSLQNRELRNRLELTIERKMTPGEQLGRFGGVGRDGRYREIDLRSSNRPTLLIGFSAACSACQESFERMKRLADGLDEGRWQVIWLSNDPWPMTKRFFDTAAVDDLVLSEFSCQSRNDLGLRWIPRLVVLEPGGSIGRSWRGGLNSRAWREIDSYLDFATQAMPSSQAALDELDRAPTTVGSR